jgi:hypothetical protein
MLVELFLRIRTAISARLEGTWKLRIVVRIVILMSIGIKLLVLNALMALIRLGDRLVLRIVRKDRVVVKRIIFMLTLFVWMGNLIGYLSGKNPKPATVSQKTALPCHPH